MESSVVSVSVLSCIGIVTMMIVLWKTVNWVWLKPKRMEKFLRQQGLKGNSYSFLFGDFKAMAMATKEATSKPINLSNIHHHHHHHDTASRAMPFNHLICQKYGKESFVWLGTTPSVHIMKPENIKHVLNNINDFPRPRFNPLVKYRFSGFAAMEDNEEWAKQKKIISPAFHVDKLKLVLPAVHESCMQMIKEWKMMNEERDSCELDVWPYCNNLSGDIISKTAFGSNIEEGTRLFKLLKEQAQLTTKALHSLYIPGWRLVPTKMNRRMKEIDNKIQVLLRGIIHKREEGMKKGEAAKDDLLGLLLESNDKEIKEHGNKRKMGMNTEEVINNCKLFYFAAQETTASFLNWTIVLLSMFPYWQEKAREEVNQVFASNKPHYEGLIRLKVVSMILYEVLRLYPAATGIARSVRKETKLENMTLPARAQIIIPIALIHQDPELWGDDAKEFKPERFSEGISKATKGESIYIPFGGGPKTCIGQHFALLQVKMALSLILQNFSFQLSPSYAHSPVRILVLEPHHGTPIILHNLHPLPIN